MSVAINYHRTGSGPPLVLLHGVGHHWQAWEPVIERLAGEFDVIACDTPGFGRSAPLHGGIEPTIPAYVDAFEWFFAELGLERPHVAGSSMGGGLALELARGRAASSATAFSPIGFWNRAELRYCRFSLALVGLTPPPLRAGDGNGGGGRARTPAAARPAVPLPAAGSARGGRGGAARPVGGPCPAAHAAGASRATSSTPPTSCAARP